MAHVWKLLQPSPSLPLFGDTHVIGVVLEGVDKKKLDFLNKVLSDSRYFANKATNLFWTKYSRKAKAKTAKFTKKLC